jgi:hypothetical protein
MNTNIIAKVRRVLDAAAELTQGEPARAIGYGVGAVVYIVARYSGAIDDIPFEDAVLLTVGYIATISATIESIRHLVTPVADPNLN